MIRCTLNNREKAETVALCVYTCPLKHRLTNGTIMYLHYKHNFPNAKRANTQQTKKNCPISVMSPPCGYVLKTQLPISNDRARLLDLLPLGIWCHWDDWNPPELLWGFLKHCLHLHLVTGYIISKYFLYQYSTYHDGRANRVKVFCQHLEIVHHLSSSWYMYYLTWHLSIKHRIKNKWNIITTHFVTSVARFPLILSL